MKRGPKPKYNILKNKKGYHECYIGAQDSYTGKRIKIENKDRNIVQIKLDEALLKKDNFGRQLKSLTPEIESAVVTGLDHLSYVPTPAQIVQIFLNHNDEYEANISTETFTDLWTGVMRKINPDFSPEKIGVTDKGLNFGKHYSGMRHIGKRFNEKYGKRLVVKITRREIMSFINSTKVNQESKTSYRQALGAIFSDAVERFIIDSNPCHKNTRKRYRIKKPKALTMDKIILILSTMPEELIPYYAISLFAGLRQSEIFNLVWEDVNFEENVIIVRNPKGSTDRGTPNRIAQIIEPLIQWLKPFRGKTGLVFPANWKKTKVDDHRREIGFLVNGIGKAENFKLYPSNCLRHTGCTAWSGEFTRGIAAKQCGNSEKKQASNYDHVWTKKQAEEFFSLCPDKINSIQEAKLTSTKPERKVQ